MEKVKKLAVILFGSFIMRETELLVSLTDPVQQSKA
jgi:hypothetical protein